MTVIVFFLSYFTEFTVNMTSSQFPLLMCFPLTNRKPDFSKGQENRLSNKYWQKNSKPYVVTSIISSFFPLSRFQIESIPYNINQYSLKGKWSIVVNTLFKYSSCGIFWTRWMALYIIFSRKILTFSRSTAPEPLEATRA